MKSVAAMQAVRCGVVKVPGKPGVGVPSGISVGTVATAKGLRLAISLGDDQGEMLLALLDGPQFAALSVAMVEAGNRCGAGQPKHEPEVPQ